MHFGQREDLSAHLFWRSLPAVEMTEGAVEMTEGAVEMTEEAVEMAEGAVEMTK